ncbi:MAG: hypothetical protein R3E68_00335 [Burkholderiaceae bacterium]
MLPDDIGAVIHLAAVTSGVPAPGQDEVAAAQRLLAAASDRRVPFVFVSSQTASEHAPTAYGRTKWRIEQLTLAQGGCVVRPGQVYGGPERGLFGLLARLRRVPVLPAFVPPPRVQPVHVDDLAQALLACTAPQGRPGVLCIGDASPITFTRFLALIAHGRTGRRPLFVPVPVLLVRLAGRLVGPVARERLGLARLTSLFELPPMDTDADLRSWACSCAPSPPAWPAWGMRIAAG